MSFKWKVEDLALMNDGCNIYIANEKIYRAENELTRQEKIDFLDDVNDGITSYILNLADRYEKDRDSLPKDNYGRVKTVSLKAWINRYDKANLVNNDAYNRGITVVPPYRYLNHLNENTVDICTSSTYSDYVDEAFHLQLKELEKQERRYFKEHDEYQILKAKVSEYSDKYGTFGLNVWKTGDGLFFYKNDDVYCPRRQLTLDELKLLNGKYEEIESFYAKITAALPYVDYDHEYKVFNKNSKLPDRVMSSFINKKTVIRIDNQEQANLLANELKKRHMHGLVPEHYEYDPKFPYFYIGNNGLASNKNFYDIFEVDSISCFKFSDIIEDVI